MTELKNKIGPILPGVKRITVKRVLGDHEEEFLFSLHGWLSHYFSKGEEILEYDKNGIMRQWVFNPYKTKDKSKSSWEGQLPFCSMTIKRIVARLEMSGVLLVEDLSWNRGIRPNFYTINYERLDELVKAGKKVRFTYTYQPQISNPALGLFVIATTCEAQISNTGTKNPELGTTCVTNSNSLNVITDNSHIGVYMSNLSNRVIDNRIQSNQVTELPGNKQNTTRAANPALAKYGDYAGLIDEYTELNADDLKGGDS